MRVDEVRAEAFGPLPSGATLHLAPGLTVVWGGNEAGKSSWHGALYTGLCGQRRGPGKTSWQRHVEQAHRPWDGSAWRVGTTVTLASGRVLVLRHDLDSPERSRVTDRDTGEDLTGELIQDGGADGAVLLGLTRRTLPHTVMVRQADLLACTDGAPELQHVLQRAAATAGDAATADEAIHHIERVRAESVGTEQAPTRPLARALAALADADRELAAAQAEHAQYARLRAEHDEAASTRAHQELWLAQLDAELARRRATALSRRLQQAEQLASRLPGWLVEEAEVAGQGDGGAAGGDAGTAGGDGVTAADPEAELAAEVARARTAWELRPGPPQLPDGPSAAQLRSALDRLPDEPQGDTQVHHDVERAEARWRDAAAARQRHERHEPTHAAPPVDADPGELREAADTLAGEPPGVDEELADRVRELQAQRNQRRSRRGWGLGVTGATALMAVAALVGGQAALAAAGGVVAAVVAAAALLVGRFDGDDELANGRAELAAQRRDAAKEAERRQRVEERVAELGAVAKPEQLRELAGDIEAAHAQQRRRAAWAAEREPLDGELAHARQDLARTLRDRGAAVDDDGDLQAAVEAYRQACRERAEQAQQAARREDLTARLSARRDREQQAAEQRRQRREADAALLAAGRRIAAESADPAEVPAAVAAVEREGEPDNGEPDASDPDRGEAVDGRPAEDDAGARAQALGALDAALAQWQQVHGQRQSQRSAHERDRAHLASLLRGATLARLRSAAQEAWEAAESRDAEPGAPAPDVAGAEGLDDDALAEQRRQTVAALDRARQQEAELHGSLRRQEETMRAVAEAEEARERHAAEVERLRSLGEVLDTARGHLRRASERVNRDVAPALRHTVERWLPMLTGGRYHHVAVDPTTLEVTVDTPEAGWRPATRLSHGTSEQIYLLLRVALAEHLVTTGEAAPLLLDDPTAQSDDERTEAILWLLRELARDRQVVVFSQETLARDWARAHLDGEGHRLVVLDEATRRPGEEPARSSHLDDALAG